MNAYTCAYIYIFAWIKSCTCCNWNANDMQLGFYIYQQQMRMRASNNVHVIRRTTYIRVVKFTRCRKRGIPPWRELDTLIHSCYQLFLVIYQVPEAQNSPILV